MSSTVIEDRSVAAAVRDAQGVGEAPVDVAVVLSGAQLGLERKPASPVAAMRSSLSAERNQRCFVELGSSQGATWKSCPCSYGQEAGGLREGGAGAEDETCTLLAAHAGENLENLDRFGDDLSHPGFAAHFHWREGKDRSWPGAGTSRRSSRRSASCSSIAASTRASGQRSPRCPGASAWHRKTRHTWLYQYRVDTGEQPGITTDHAAQYPSAQAYERASSSARSRSSRQRRLASRGRATRDPGDLRAQQQHRRAYGVAPICRALTSHGIQIAPRTYDAHVRRAPSRRSLWDTAITEILASYDEPDAEGRRPPRHATARPRCGPTCCARASR